MERLLQCWSFIAYQIGEEFSQSIYERKAKPGCDRVKTLVYHIQANPLGKRLNRKRENKRFHSFIHNKKITSVNIFTVATLPGAFTVISNNLPKKNKKLNNTATEVIRLHAVPHAVCPRLKGRSKFLHRCPRKLASNATARTLRDFDSSFRAQAEVSLVLVGSSVTGIVRNIG